MQLEIGRLRLDPGAYEYFKFDFSPADSGDGCELLTPVHATGSVVFGGNAFLVSGSLTGGVRIPCSRCLTPVSLDLSADMEEEFEEREFPGEDAVLDMDDLAFQIWITSVPMQVLCKDDCKGLCPRCGVNLNDGDCGCSDTMGDPRMEVLKGWMDKQK